MAERAEFYVKNMMRKKNVLKVTRNEPNGIQGFKTEVMWGGEERVPLSDRKSEMIIHMPVIKNSKSLPIKVKSDVSLSMFFNRKNSYWRFKIDPNDDPPDTPVTVNIEVGDDEPVLTEEDEPGTDGGD